MYGNELAGAALMLSCKQASHLLSLSRERALPWRQRLGLRLHLSLCGACRQFALQLKLLRQAARLYGARVEHDERLRLPKDARGRIAQAMQQQVRANEAARQNPDQNFSD